MSTDEKKRKALELTEIDLSLMPVAEVMTIVGSLLTQRYMNMDDDKLNRLYSDLFEKQQLH